jgi:ribonuclease HI
MGVLVRQNGKFLCLWKHYQRASNNVMELSAVISGLRYLPPGMVMWLSTDSQYVQKGISEWMPKWKRNGWKNSKKAGGANKTLWLALETAIGRHGRVEFAWVKAHSGLLHNEIADILATRGVNGTSYCPTDWFDKLPDDTEQEDDPNIPITEVITQPEEWADDEHLPSFGTRAQVYGLNAEEDAEKAEEAEEAARIEREAERERSIRHFLHETYEISSTPVTKKPSWGLLNKHTSTPVTDDEDDGNTNGVVLVGPGMTTVNDSSELPEPQQEPEFYLQVGHVGAVDLPESMAPSPWSATWAQAKAEATQ